MPRQDHIGCQIIRRPVPIALEAALDDLTALLLRCVSYLMAGAILVTGIAGTVARFAT